MRTKKTSFLAATMAIAALGVLGITTTAIMSGVAIPVAHAKVNCSVVVGVSATCSGGTGQQGGGSGGHATKNINGFSQSGGAGHQGGSHVTGNFKTGQTRCVGSRCP